MGAVIPFPCTFVNEMNQHDSEHMDQHMLEAEKLSNDAGMTARVYDWQNSLEPLLIAEEERKPFDIHEYGDDMLDRLEEGKFTAE